ncbi:hypothetical protein Celaphus_00007796 [Cervus elaphus hippelaphus]|uniref:Piezo transmembrane helical unit domain-containing protein n=1 Tax=Cervus elaphus hippelaphus TaxID=46360 RepID=A0A212CB84_CEREH|nr:hypothetical protein Celaphus_00007796 [Cervus elaphus hippelaphus]
MSFEAKAQSISHQKFFKNDVFRAYRGHRDARYLPPSRLPPEEDELEQSDRFYRSLPRLVKLTFALHQAAVAKSETLCYLVIILNHTLSASILSMVLPILSFLWAMLSVPRPSKRFWMAAIYYTEATVVVKYFSQFGLFPWTTKRYAGINREKPFSLPNILGVEKRDGSELGDLVQLLALFFHRSTLQRWWCELLMPMSSSCPPGLGAVGSAAMRPGSLQGGEKEQEAEKKCQWRGSRRWAPPETGRPGPLLPGAAIVPTSPQMGLLEALVGHGTQRVTWLPSFYSSVGPL